MTYISIASKNGIRSVVVANETQTKALDDFLNGDEGNTGICQYYSTNKVLIEYLYELKLDNDKVALISKNYEKLNNYIGFINRLTN